MIVCIAEKPSVARDIASILGANRRVVQQGAGYIEGNGYQITWTFGHLCTLKEPHDYRPDWKPWRLEALPMIPDKFGIKGIDIELYQRQLEVIQRLMQTATMVINCGDAGQEGELIQRWVLQKVGCSVPIKRLWISSLTDDAIREGFAKLRSAEEFDSLYAAGLARAIGDWLLGMNATRLYTMKYGTRGQILSIGRVQTPTLALIVQRQQEIDQFKPETYWELKTVYRDTTFTAEKGKYTEYAKALTALNSITESELYITSVKKKTGKELPPRLFDLTSLQVACNKKFGMTAEQTLSTVQALYEKKITTYPRVDTTYLSEDIYSRIREILIGLVNYRHLTTPILAEKTLRKSKKVFDNSKVTDHHAIIPTGQPVHGLNSTEEKVFDLITRHFISAFYPDCSISTTTVVGKANAVSLKTSGKEILSPGWRVVFSDLAKDTLQDPKTTDEDNDKAEEAESVLPTFIEGEHGPHQPNLKERQTQPPKPYSEATLLRAMETAGKLIDNEDLREALKENGIGRPSTRANIIETLFKRGYIVKEKRNQIRATETGISLIKTINYELLKSAELTGQWESKLRQIERKELDVRIFIEELKNMVRHLTYEVLTPKHNPTSLPMCPKCHSGYIIRGRTAYGCNRYASGCDYRLSFEEYEQIYRKGTASLT